jgi:heptaprenyl diphosphate synthase
VDDILDFTGTEKQLGKPTGSDLIQGTITLPVLLLLEQYPDEEAIKRLYRDHNDPAIPKGVVDLIRNSPGILQECYRSANEYCNLALNSLEALPKCEARDSLEGLACYIICRKK